MQRVTFLVYTKQNWICVFRTLRPTAPYCSIRKHGARHRWWSIPYFWAENLCVYLFRWMSPLRGFLCGRDCQVYIIHLCIPQCVLLEVCNRSKSKAGANILHILVMHESQLVLTKSISECSQIHRIHF